MPVRFALWHTPNLNMPLARYWPSINPNGFTIMIHVLSTLRCHHITCVAAFSVMRSKLFVESTYSSIANAKTTMNVVALAWAIEPRGGNSMKRILLTEWGVEPRVFGLDEFIKAQCFDVQGNHIMPEDGGMSCEEIDSLRNMEVADKVRIGDTDFTEIYVERLSDQEDMAASQAEDLAMILTQMSYMCGRLAIELPKVEDGIDICAAERARIVSHLIDGYLRDWM